MTIDTERVTLRPGDHILTEGVTDPDYHAVARAFMNAGAEKGEYVQIRSYKEWQRFGWHERKRCLYLNNGNLSLQGRTLTVHQVLTATNAGVPAQKAGRKVMEHYKDALKAMADADGWIPWHGGDRPVGCDALVNLIFRDGRMDYNPVEAEPLNWEHDDMEYDIIAYRIHQPAAKQWPEYGEKYMHRNGGVYRVILISNRNTDKPDQYPVTVIYQNTDNGSVWSRPVDDWWRSFTKLDQYRERVIEDMVKCANNAGPYTEPDPKKGMRLVMAALYDGGYRKKGGTPPQP